MIRKAGVIFIILAAQCLAKTIIIKPDGTGIYPTIQAAIDASGNGDIIIASEGVYRGEGNRNLNFGGKAIIVRSSEPNDNECMRNTVIDANGSGVIARFINDEGPGSVFEGFTLGAGDTSKQVRGEAGFFEFSKNARPTTRRLRNKETVSKLSLPAKALASVYDANYPGYIPPFNGRAWDGRNPYYQPASTTDYYGSGDADNDGQITSADVLYAQEIVNHVRDAVIRADVDGDGDVDSGDVLLIEGAISGEVLPAWWNKLTTSAQRNSWITKVMQRDTTDNHLYQSSFFICYDFAYQTFVHTAFLRGDMAARATEYDGGQTVFNLPMYFVLVRPPTGHGINAILIGENPLNFQDWRFVEPQDDTTIVPGGWNMRYGSDFEIFAPTLHGQTEVNANQEVPAEVMAKFRVLETGITLLSHSENLIRSRPLPVEKPADNRTDMWNPRFIEIDGQAYMIFEKMTEDLSRMTAIHYVKVGYDLSQAKPLISGPHGVRLLDIATSPDGMVHLLWEGTSGEDKQNLFHGILNPETMGIYSISQVAGGLRLASMGKIVIRPPYNEIHILWFENMGFYQMYDYGIHWSRWNGTGWTTPQNLVAGTYKIFDYPDWINRQLARYMFDAVALDNGDILTVWAENDLPVYYVSQLRYDGASWTSSRIEATDLQNSVRGVDLCKSDDGNVHLAYWLGKEMQAGGTEEGRGNLYYRNFDGSTWAEPVLIDGGSGKSCEDSGRRG